MANSIAGKLAALGERTTVLDVRSLPAADLLGANSQSQAIAAALALVDAASYLVLVSPVYKAAYSGLLKVFLDLLPQYGLRGKTILPILTGGSPAHFLAIDYALRPVLSSMSPEQILGGLYVIDKQITVTDSGGILLPEDVQERLDGSLRRLADWPRESASVIAAQ